MSLNPEDLKQNAKAARMASRGAIGKISQDAEYLRKVSESESRYLKQIKALQAELDAVKKSSALKIRAYRNSISK